MARHPIDHLESNLTLNERQAASHLEADIDYYLDNHSHKPGEYFEISLKIDNCLGCDTKAIFDYISSKFLLITWQVCDWKEPSPVDPDNPNKYLFCLRVPDPKSNIQNS